MPGPAFFDGSRTNSLRVVYNELLDEFLVTVQRHIYPEGPDAPHNVVSAQRVSESGVSPVVQIADGGEIEIYTHAIAYAPVADTTPAGGRYLFVVGHLTPAAALMDSALNVITLVPVTWGTPDGSVIDYDVAYGDVDGRNLFLIGYSDFNNCEPSIDPPPCSAIADQRTGIWGTYVDPQFTSYKEEPVPDFSFPISSISGHKISHVQGPKLAHAPDAHGCFVVWREAPSNMSTEGLLTHIRGAFVDYYADNPLTAPNPEPSSNTVISDVTGSCPPGSPAIPTSCARAIRTPRLPRWLR